MSRIRNIPLPFWKANEKIHQEFQDTGNMAMNKLSVWAFKASDVNFRIRMQGSTFIGVRRYGT